MKSNPWFVRTWVPDLFAIGSPLFRLDVPGPRLASRRCAMLIGRIRSASSRTAATAVPRLAPLGPPPRGARGPLDVAVGPGFGKGCGQGTPVALDQQGLYVDLGQGRRTLAPQ